MLQPDIVKLDPALIQGLAQDEGRQQFVDAIADLTTKIDAQALAEGVDDMDDLRWVHDLDIPLAQGFALGEPQALDHVISRLGDHLERVREA